MYDRPFGVEIECNSNGRGIGGTKAILQNNGFSHWADRITYDGSDIEIRSPILKGNEGLKELKGVMNLLQSKNYYATEDDGMHCHFDAADLNESDILRVMRSWDNNSEIIHQFLGERFYNEYCTYDWDLDGAEDGRDSYGYDHSVWEYDGQKCYAIEPRNRLRTLEFRQHYGTLVFEDARAWILLVQALIKKVKQEGAPIKKVSMEELFKLARVYKVAQKNLTSRDFNVSSSVYNSGGGGW